MSRRGTGGEPQQGNGRGCWRDGNWCHAERPHFHAQQPETGGRGWTQCPPEGSQFPPLEYQDQGRGGKRPQYPQQPGRGGRGWHQRQQGWGRGGERSQVPYHPEIIEQNWPQRILERPPYPPRQHQQQGRGSGGEGRGLGSFQGGGFAYSQLPRAPPQHQQQGQGSGGDGRHCDHPQSRRDWGHGSGPNYSYSPQPRAPPQHQQHGQGSGDDGCRCDHPQPRRDWGHGSGPNYGYSPQPRAPPQNEHQGQGSGGDGRSCNHPKPQHDWGHGSGPNYGYSPQPCGPPHHHQQGPGSGSDGRHCDNPQRQCDWGHGSGPNYNYRVGGYRDNPQPRGAPQYQQGQGRGGEGRGSDHNQPQRGWELGSRPHYQGGGSSDSPHPHGPPQGQGGQSSGYQSHHGRSPQPRGGAYGERNKGKAREASYSSPGPPSPELHQTTEAPHVSSDASSSAQPSSSSSRALGLSAVTQQLQQLSVQSETGAVKPSTGKKHSFADRPNIGSAGRKCIVRANHFVAEIAKKEIFQYDVCITPEVNHSKLNREIMEALVTRYRETHLGGCRPAYDGSKCLYTAGELPFPSKEFQITLPQRPTAPYSVVIRVTSTGERINLDHIAEFLNGLRKEVPQDALQVLDIVLKGSPTSRYTTVGRSFFSPVLGRRQNLGGGIESWRGFYQSIRPTQMGLSLNVDISATAVIQPLPVIDFLTVYLGHLRNPRDQGVNLWHPLRDADFVKVKMVLYGLKVEVTHRGDIRRKSRIYDLTREPTRDVTFQAGDATKSVVDFFWETYGIRIQYLNLPCLKVGNEKRPNYLPMEVCRLVEKQRFTKKLTENQIKTLLAYTCQRPQDRESLIGQMVDHNDYNEDIYCQEFGLTVNRNLTTVNARILKSPELKYHDSGNQKVICPQDGRWNMHNKKLLNGGRVRNWICIYFPQQQRNANRRKNAAHQDNAQNAVRGFCHGLAHMCVEMGMGFSLEPVLPHKSVLCDQLEQGLRALYNDAMNILRPHGEELDLLVAILPNNNSSLYGHLKKICETDLGIVSQCCLTNNILQMKPEYLSNVALKINVKVGGRNTVLVNALSMKVPGISDVPTIIFGADVTHPRPGEDSACSISAVVASQDWPHLTKYAGLVNAQRHREEIIEDLYKEWQHPQRGTVAGGMIRELLISFRGATNVKPERIIYYRDGVSDGQFHQVLLCELDAIRKACFSLEPNYQPRVTFVVVQKRHHTRLFLDNYNTRHRREHISPGTVVDSKICHPNEFDFYLCSHAGIRGTSRPAHYYVLWDENKFSADNIQTLTNDLCYTYVRCTRSVSIVPPVYYAHLAAFRARFYIEPEIGSAEDQSVREGEGGQQLQSTTRIPGPVKPLPALKEKVKRVMFYC